MRLSTRGRYGLKAMFHLACHYGEGPIPLSSIASTQGIPENYLEQLVSVLRRAGLLNSVRGAQGGYMLARLPELITVGDVLRVLEGALAPADCVVENTEGCDKEESCVTKLVWMQIRDSINEVVDSITLQDMLEDQIQLESNHINA